MNRPFLRRLLSIPAAAAAALAAVALSPAPAAHAADGWISGPLQESWITNCSSIILGNPYQEFGIGAYASYYGDRTASPISPRTGDSTYLDVYAELVGNHCSTPFIFPKFVLPAGVEFDKTAPIKCYYTPPAGTQYEITHAQQCPQWANVAADGRYSNSYSGWYSGWPLPSGPNFTFGSAWEFLVPIKSTTQQNGSQLRVQLDLADGNGSAPLNLSVPFWTGAPRTTLPGTATNVTATPTSPTTANVGFTAPGNGGTPITSYVAQCISGDGGTTRAATGTAAPIAVRNLTPGKSYRCKVRATNAVGNGAFSPLSASFTQPASRPGVPTGVTASSTTAGRGQVGFAAPASNGGSAITSYFTRCDSTNGGVTRSRSGATSPLLVTGLTSGKTYHCQVRATNAAGTSPMSAYSATFVAA
ncbi:fibronectin type III domain-containing protein [Nocardioides humilatus]|uniref:Fibronectin type III domain-containing protein n=1 Tax=Nocardioides humilatus TaxID=2607660 RepID=A0A5B1LM10_9ACTN|nr:fibronectin type III domain-containing protein [Nocardioides humilatus]KAA1421583.1 fibronectin type III domain-containing protein [Nocardioides humilatus]